MPEAGSAAIGAFLGIYAVLETQWGFVKWVAGKLCCNRFGQRSTQVECQETDFNRCVRRTNPVLFLIISYAAKVGELFGADVTSCPVERRQLRLLALACTSRAARASAPDVCIPLGHSYPMHHKYVGQTLVTHEPLTQAAARQSGL